MRKFLAILLVVGAVVFLSHLPATPKDAPAEISVFFSPDGGGEKAIIEEIKSARKSIKAAMYLFTSNDIATALSQKAKDCKITVLMDKNKAESTPNSQHKSLAKSKIDVRLLAPPKPAGNDQPEASFHHKFAIIDDATVITGSYNWSVYAETTNYEDVLIIRDKNLAAQYLKRFERILEELDEK